MFQNLRRTIVIEGVRYHDDRPKSCERCFFWKNKRTGCILGKENCYYLAHRIISILMALALCLGSCPVTAFAYTGTEEEIKAVEGDTETADGEERAEVSVTVTAEGETGEAAEENGGVSVEEDDEPM